MAKQNTFELRGDYAVLFCPDTHGTLHEVLVDADNIPEIIAFGFWRAYEKSHNPAKPLLYAYASQHAVKISLHRFILKPQPRVPIDHRNHLTLDNRRENLRITTASQNSFNRRRDDGMCVYNRNNRFQVRVEINQVQRFLGSFISEQAAKDCRDEFLRTQGVNL